MAGNKVDVSSEGERWPGWPGENVFRLVVPVSVVGGLIGRKGEMIKKLMEETRARVRVLDAAVGTNDRIVLVSAKEEPESVVSPAMAAVLKIFKRVSGIDSEDDGTGPSAAGMSMCSIRLLAATSQAINLIGKGGGQIKAIQESSGASVRVLSEGDMPFYATPDERIIEMQGDGRKVHKALEAVIGHLRKFLVDRSVIPLFEKSPNMTVTQDPVEDTWTVKNESLFNSSSVSGFTNDYPLLPKSDSLFLGRDSHMESRSQHHGLSLYGQDPALTGVRPLGQDLARAGAHHLGTSRVSGPVITQITQTMQIPLSYAEDIIGIKGTNIGYIRRTSGAVLTVHESRGIPDEITVEIKGTSSQVQTAQQLIQEFIASHKEDPPISSYGSYDAGSRSYSHLDSNYPPTHPPHGGYGLPGVGGGGGYSSYSSYS